MNPTAISRVLSHALRHEPWLYEIELNEEGWADVDCVVTALRVERPAWASLSAADLATAIASSSKQRHEIRDNRIRALYGHSISGRLKKTKATPPNRLFHGTAPGSVATIKQEGLLPMKRQYVHCSVDVPTAEQVGKRKDQQPVILEIESGQAHRDGVAFYEGNEQVWLADAIPPQFITLLK